MGGAHVTVPFEDWRLRVRMNMATKSGPKAGERVHLLQSEQPASNSPRRPCNCCRAKWRALRIVRYKGALLVLLWNFLAFTVKDSFGPFSSIKSQFVSGVVYALMPSLCILFLCPLAGWLADVYFGRYKVIYASLWLIWLGNVFGAVTLIIHWLLPETANGLKYSIQLLAYVLVNVGFAGFKVNVVPFGTDQMVEASGDDLSVFVHWFVWTWFAGRSVVSILGGFLPGPGEAELFQTLFGVLRLSLALLSDVCFRQQLTIEPNSQNPLKMVIKVLRYAATHNYPTNRSALTYWEEEIPSRINLGKSKYGGPFTEEEVEDVKTFLRILAVVISSGTFAFTISILFLTASSLVNLFYPYQSVIFLERLVELSYNNSILVVILAPLLELAGTVCTWASRWNLSMLKRVGLSGLVALIATFFLFAMDTTAHAHRELSNSSCILAESTLQYSNIHYLWVAFPFGVLTALHYLLFYTAGFEFICAQTPYSMKGLLIGVFYGVVGFSYLLGTIFYVVSYLLYYNFHPQFSCGLYYFLAAGLSGTVGLGVFCVVARWYKKRQRDELVSDQIFIEDAYNRYYANLNTES